MRLELSGGREIELAFEGTAERVHGAALAAMGDATEFLRQHIIADYLSGQALNVKSGDLQRAIVARAEDGATEITGTVGVDPSSPAAIYGAVHEFGGTFEVPEHLRISSLGKEFTVRAHTATFPERSFLRAALFDSEDQVAQVFCDRFAAELRS